MAGTLKVYPGISSGSTKTIPKDWDAAWFRRWISSFATNADTRNAKGADGITISGNLNTVATIGLGPPISLPDSSFYVDGGGLTLVNNSDGPTVTVLNYAIVSAAPASPQYYYIGKLPANSAGDFSSVTISGVFNVGFNSTATCSFEIELGTRNQFFGRALLKSGPDFAQYTGYLDFTVYQQADLSYNLYFVAASSQYVFCAFDVLHGVQFTAQRPDQIVGTSSAPSGTEVWDLTNTALSYSASLASQVSQWIAAPLNANIANYGSGFDDASYMKDPTGRVFIRGLIAGSGLTVGSTIFTLPLGYRPGGQQLSLLLGYNTAYGGWRVDVDTNGAVVITALVFGAGSPTTFFSLDPLTFMAGY